MKRELYFATPIYIEDVGTPEYNKFLEEKIKDWSTKEKGLTISNSSGWHSPTNMHEDPTFEHLVGELDYAMKRIFMDESLDNEPFLANMWANINYKGSYNKAHLHANSLWSGVYYIKTPKDCGVLKLQDPKSVSLMVKPKRNNNNFPQHSWTQISFEAVAGRLIIFPSYLTHWVEENKNEEERISVSFNVLQKGMFV